MNKKSDKSKGPIFTANVTRLFILLTMILIVCCEGPEGPMGPEGSTGSQGEQGPIGPEGPPGFKLISEYTGTIPYDGTEIFQVILPEIKDRRQSTFVMSYWTFSTTPDLWVLMADGWLDSGPSRICSVSWTIGVITFFGMSEGDLYLIQVFEHQ